MQNALMANQCFMSSSYCCESGFGGWVERLGGDAMVSHKNDAARDDLIAGLEIWSAETGWSPQRAGTMRDQSSLDHS